MFAAFNAVYDYVPSGESIALAGGLLVQGAGVAVSAAATGLSSLTSSKKKVPFTNPEVLEALKSLERVLDDGEDPLADVNLLMVLFQGTHLSFEQLCGASPLENEGGGLTMKNRPDDDIRAVLQTMIDAKRSELAMLGVFPELEIEPDLESKHAALELTEIGDFDDFDDFVMVEPDPKP